jgi:hypothetical protein
VGHAVGDAFLVPQPAVAQPSDAALITLKTLDSVAEPSRVDADRRCTLTASLASRCFQKTAPTPKA